MTGRYDTDRALPDELTADQIDELAAALRALQAELRADLERPSDSAAIVDLDTPQGRVSRIDAMQQQQMALAQRRRARVRLTMVDRALVAVDDGEYGDCGLCGDPIGYRRLQVRPESRLCVPCTESAEQRRR